MGLFSKKPSVSRQSSGAESEGGYVYRRPSATKSRSGRNPFLENPVFQNVHPLSSHLPPQNSPDGPPPPYTPKDATTPSCPPYSATSPRPSSDSPYAFLGQFDTVFLIDDSGSMAGRSWRETESALAAIAPICTSYDTDGIDIYFLNHRNRMDSPSLGAYRGITSPARVHEIFKQVSPRGGTPTGARLGHILHPYLKRLVTTDVACPTANIDTVVRPLNIIVITDGIPSDDVESVIVNAARKLDKLNAQPWQVGVQFFQVGNEPDAAEELRELDDALADQRGVRDMVDTVPYKKAQNGATSTLTGEAILKVVLGAVHRKYDRRNASGRRERSSQRS